MDNPTVPRMCRPQFAGAFTFAELALVVTLVVTFAVVLLPPVLNARSGMRDKACAGNLREIGVWVNMYAFDHEATLPPVEDGWVRAIAAMGKVEVDQGARPRGRFRCPNASFRAPLEGVAPAAWWRGSDYGLNHHLASRLRDRDGNMLPEFGPANTRNVFDPSGKAVMADAVGGNYFDLPDLDPTIAGMSRHGVSYAASLPPAPARPLPYLRHAGGTANFLFLDGQVKLLGSWPEFSTGPYSRGYLFWHAEHPYPGSGRQAPADPRPSR